MSALLLMLLGLGGALAASVKISVDPEEDDDTPDADDSVEVVSPSHFIAQASSHSAPPGLGKDNPGLGRDGNPGIGGGPNPGRDDDIPGLGEDAPGRDHEPVSL